MAAYRGELEVIVTSAEALDSKSMSRLEKALKGAQLAEGKTLKINNRVGPVVSTDITRLVTNDPRSTLASSVVCWSTSETRQVSHSMQGVLPALTTAVDLSASSKVNRFNHALTRESQSLLRPSPITMLTSCRGCLDMQAAIR